jgi:hypothetical protein
MKNVHLIPTEKPSRLFNCFGKLNIGDYITSREDLQVTNQNIYITSDEEIKKGDWCYHPLLKGGSIIQSRFDNPNSIMKKIILTTDPDLIKDSVQAIDDRFLEWFVKNPSCEFVEVQDWVDYYKIFIPQEEPKQDSVFENAKLVLREHLLENKEQVAKDLQEMKEKSSTNRDETLEDAAEMYSNSHQDVSGELGKYLVKAVFQDGANWQAERMYSEKEVFEIVATILHTPTLRDGSWKNISKWFEKNKKK